MVVVPVEVFVLDAEAEPVELVEVPDSLPVLPGGGGGGVVLELGEEVGEVVGLEVGLEPGEVVGPEDGA